MKGSVEVSVRVTLRFENHSPVYLSQDEAVELARTILVATAPEPSAERQGLQQAAPQPVAPTPPYWNNLPTRDLQQEIQKKATDAALNALRAHGPVAIDPRPAATEKPFGEDDVKWIVNSLGELGVQVHGRCFFCYKGGSLEYAGNEERPILFRSIGKREFGETVWPAKWTKFGYRPEGPYTEEVYAGVMGGPVPDEYKWRPIPKAPKAGKK